MTIRCCHRLLVVFFICFVPLLTQAQNPNNLQYPARVKEINRDIWIPYTAAIAANSVSKVTALLSPDFIRVHPFQKQILDVTQLTQELQKSFGKKGDETSDRLTGIDFRFSERVISETFASEKGVYKYNFTTPHGEKQFAHGYFHILSRKEKGVWKMTAFYSSIGDSYAAVGDYQKAFPMEHISKY